MKRTAPNDSAISLPTAKKSTIALPKDRRGGRRTKWVATVNHHPNLQHVTSDDCGDPVAPAREAAVPVSSLAEQHPTSFTFEDAAAEVEDNISEQ